MSGVKADTESMLDLLKLLKDGYLQLPEFQRDFEWKAKNQKLLFESLFLKHPIGSLMVLNLDTADPMFAWSELDQLFVDSTKKYDTWEKQRNAGGSITAQPPEKLLLDGQQRLTTMSQLIQNTTDKMWYLDCSQLRKKWKSEGTPVPGTDVFQDWLDSGDISFSEMIVNGKNPKNPIGELSKKRSRLPLTIFASKADFTTKINAYLMQKMVQQIKIKSQIKNFKSYKGNSSISELKEESEDLQSLIDFVPIIQHLGGNIFDTKIPVVEVPKEFSIMAVCKIFTTINQTGMKLGAFDLVVASVYSQGVRLKQDFEDLLDKNPLTKLVDHDDRKWILQSLAIVNNLKPTTNALPKNITAGMISTDLSTVGSSFEKCCSFLYEQIRVPILEKGKNSITYDRILPSLCAVQHVFDLNNSKTKPKPQQEIVRKIKSWYYSSAITKRYSTHSDTRQLSDRTDIIDWLNGDFEKDMPAWIKSPELKQEIHSTGSGSESNLVLTLLNEMNPNDIFTGKQCNYSSPDETDVHHIFPKAAMRKRLMSSKKINDKKRADKILSSDQFYIHSMVNKMLLQSKTNRDYIKDQMPSVYIKDLLTHHSEADLKAYFSTHLIDNDCYNALKADDYDEFITKRSKLIKDKINARIGIDYWD